MPYELWQVVLFLLQEYIARLARISEDNCHPQEFCWGLEESALCQMKKVPVEANTFQENCELLTIAIVNTHAIMVVKTIMNADSNASFSNITAATNR